jgi:hypothetical protein
VNLVLRAIFQLSSLADFFWNFGSDESDCDRAHKQPGFPVATIFRPCGPRFCQTSYPAFARWALCCRRYAAKFCATRRLSGDDIFERVSSARHPPYEFRSAHRLTGAGTRSPASSFSIFWLICRSANSAATRIAFLIAFAFDEPCVTMHMPLTPSRGAPPYSV